MSIDRRTRENLVGVHSDLVLVVGLALETTTVEFVVTEGVRTMERQWKLYNDGRSRTLSSKHLRDQHDGLGHAVDVMAVGDLDGNGIIDAKDSSLTWDPDLYGQIAIAMKRAAEHVGVEIRWGGEFKRFFDGPHFELV